MRASLVRLSTSRSFRALAATVLLALHVVAITAFGASRFHVPFDAAPGQAPAFHHPESEQSPPHWNRLVVSRWDSQHYINLALRGHRYCPKELIRSGRLPRPTMTCDLAFYPGYPALGWVASLGGRLPIDYVLFAISLVSSWIFLFLWTGPTIAEGLGVGATWASLLAWNAFTTAFALVTIQTEPALLALTLGAFVAFRRDRPWLAALLAGAATGIRISGAATGLALAVALLVQALRDPEKRRWPSIFAQAALSEWGLFALLGYYWYEFRDPFLYMHAHEQSYGHHPALANLLRPETSWFLRSIDSPLHEGVWVAAVVLFLVAGHRAALRDFEPSAQAFFYALALGVLGVSVLGSISRAFVGMNRYLLVVLPAFFAMGKLLARRPAVLAAWMALCLWHYWQVDLCFYVGDRGDGTFHRCHAAQCIER